MRFQVSTVAVFCFSSIASAVSVIPSPSCLNLKGAVEGADLVGYFHTIQTELCDKGCKIVADENDPFHGFLASVIQKESNNMGAPQLEPSYNKLMDSMIDFAQQNCGLKGDLCQDPSKLATAAKCIQGNAWKIILANAASIPAILAGDNCEKQVKFFSNPELWTSVFASYAREFAKTC